VAGLRRYNAGTVNGHIARVTASKKGSLARAPGGWMHYRIDCGSSPAMAMSRTKNQTLSSLIGSGVVGLMRFGLVGAVSVAIAPALAAIATLTAPVASAGVVLAVAGMALAVLSAATTLAHVTTAAGADFPAAAFVEISVVIGAFRVPARVAIGATIRAVALVLAGLAAELCLRGHDDAIIMLGVLEIALGRDHVAGGESVARERHVFLGDMRCGAPDLHVGPVRFVVPRQRILGLPATAAAAPAILLSLPHFRLITC